MAADGSTLRLSYDALGRISRRPGAGGETIDYAYDAGGHLAMVLSSMRGVLYRYGYDAALGTLSVAVRAAGSSEAFLPGQPPQVIPLTADLGDAKQFDGQPITGTMTAGGEARLLPSLSDAEVHGTNSGSVIISVDIARQGSQFVAATPAIPGLIPLTRYVDNDRTVALSRPRTAAPISSASKERRPRDQGAYTLGVERGRRCQRRRHRQRRRWPTSGQAFGSLAEDGNYNFAADLDANGAINAADRQLLAANYGFTADSTTPTFPNYFAAPTGTVWTPSTSGGNGGTTGGTIRRHPGRRLIGHGTPPHAAAQSAHGADTRAVPLAPLTNPGFGITNGTFTVSSTRTKPALAGPSAAK